MNETVTMLRGALSAQEACRHVGVSRSAYYRSLRPPSPRTKRRERSPRRLPQAVREEIRSVLNSERFMDMPPRQVWATLLDEGVYLCHWRSMYRILAEYEETRERRRLRVRPRHRKPELLAKSANELWTWDITTLRGPSKGIYYKLYVILDVFSRYVVGWTLAPCESGALAKELIAQACERHQTHGKRLVIHSDRGAPMTSRTYVQLLADLSVTGSWSRPYRSNDNPYSEAHFRTAKHHHTYEPRFGSLEDARRWARRFFDWYNNVFYHTGIALMRPATLHYGKAEEVWQARKRVMEEAYARAPERFVGGMPSIPVPPEAAWINKPDDPEAAREIAAQRDRRINPNPKRRHRRSA